LPDDDGADLPDDETAIAHGKRVIRELMQADNAYANWRMQITEGGRVVGDIPFDQVRTGYLT
jgi:hypothetical protein